MSYQGFHTGLINGLYDRHEGLVSGLYSLDDSMQSRDPDVMDYILRAKITVDIEIKAIHFLIRNLKATNLLGDVKRDTRIFAMYPFLGGNAYSHSINFIPKNSSGTSYNLQFSGGWVHSKTGALPNGTNAYADTGCPISDINTGNNHFSYYSRTNSQSDGFIGAARSSSGSMQFYLRGGFYTNQLHSANGLSIGTDAQNNIISTNTNSQGFYMDCRSSSTAHKQYKNGINIGRSDTNSFSGSYAVTNFYLGARSLAGSPNSYDNREVCFCSLGSMNPNNSIGRSYTDQEAKLFYQIVQMYQTILNRNV